MEEEQLFDTPDERDAMGPAQDPDQRDPGQAGSESEEPGEQATQPPEGAEDQSDEQG